MSLINIHDYEAAARDKLPQMIYEYYAGGADDEITLSLNRSRYAARQLKYRVLRDISQRRLETTVLGQAVSMPVIIAPTAFHAMAHSDGEIATVRAAGRAGTIMILSTLSTTAIEDVAAAASQPVWFQLYIYRDREATRGLIQRAEAAGCAAIVLTVDAQIWGRREHDVRNRFQLPAGLTVKNLMPAGKEAFPRDQANSGLAAYVTQMFDPDLTWKDVDWLCKTTKLPVILKGIVNWRDAQEAVDHGIAGIIVSNHGGRQLDTAPATIDVLQEITAAVAGRIEILIDGGVRRGTDVIKALALGAGAVAIGRPILWGLAVAGETGVASVLDLLRQEIDLALGLCGCADLEDLNADLVAEFAPGGAGI